MPQAETAAPIAVRQAKRSANAADTMIRQHDGSWSNSARTEGSSSGESRGRVSMEHLRKRCRSLGSERLRRLHISARNFVMIESLRPLLRAHLGETGMTTLDAVVQVTCISSRTLVPIHSSFYAVSLRRTTGLLVHHAPPSVPPDHPPCPSAPSFLIPRPFLQPTSSFTALWTGVS